MLVPANPAERLVSNPWPGSTAVDHDKNVRKMECDRFMFQKMIVIV